MSRLFETQYTLPHTLSSAFSFLAGMGVDMMVNPAQKAQMAMDHYRELDAQGYDLHRCRATLHMETHKVLGTWPDYFKVLSVREDNQIAFEHTQDSHFVSIVDATVGNVPYKEGGLSHVNAEQATWQALGKVLNKHYVYHPITLKDAQVQTINAQKMRMSLAFSYAVDGMGHQFTVQSVAASAGQAYTRAMIQGLEYGLYMQHVQPVRAARAAQPALLKQSA